MFSFVVYKIQRTKDGLFSTGSASPVFNRRGKTWGSIGAVKSHLRLLKNRDSLNRYDGCEVVEHITEEGSKYLVSEFIK